MLSRVVIYSHDTFGLGHLRRSRAIANAIVEECPGTSVVIISGSPGHRQFRVRQRGRLHPHPGRHQAARWRLSLAEPQRGARRGGRVREALILQAVKSFRPDVFIVDKEPTGFRGEVIPALDYLQQAGCRLVLGIRDVMDEPALLLPEWERKEARQALIRYYDEIWVYGLKDVSTLPPSTCPRMSRRASPTRDISAGKCRPPRR